MAGAPVILAFGDSLIAGYGVEPSQSFAAALEGELQADQAGTTVLNAGVSGDTTKAGLERLPDVLRRLPVKPDLTIVQLGANDLLGLVPLRTIKDNLDAIVAELRHRDMPVLLATIEAPAIFGRFGRACAKVYEDLGAKHGISRASFFPKGVFANRRYCLSDRLHPNAQGIAAIAKAFAPAVRSALASRRGASDIHLEGSAPAVSTEVRRT
jgi:acyl-CoA thioesterase-1